MDAAPDDHIVGSMPEKLRSFLGKIGAVEGWGSPWAAPLVRKLPSFEPYLTTIPKIRLTTRIGSERSCRYRALNSVVECHLHTVEVTGSSPVVPTIVRF